GGLALVAWRPPVLLRQVERNRYVTAGREWATAAKARVSTQAGGYFARFGPERPGTVRPEALEGQSLTTTGRTESPLASTSIIRNLASVLRPFVDWLLTGSPIRALAVILAAGLALRLVLLPLYAYLPGDALDEYAWERWMGAIHEHGILN